MKRFYSLLVAFMALAISAHAQFNFGVEAGLNLNKLSLSNEIISSSNRAGFFLGPKVKFTVPIIGLGVDAAILYDNKSAAFDVNGTTESKTLHYVCIPVNARYQLGLGDLVAVYVATGPQWNWNVGDKEWNVGKVLDAAGNAVNNLNTTFASSSFSWNVGAGVMLIQHLQVGVTYNIPLNKGGNIYDTVTGAVSNLKNSTWQVRAAYFF